MDPWRVYIVSKLIICRGKMMALKSDRGLELQCHSYICIHAESGQLRRIADQENM